MFEHADHLLELDGTLRSRLEQLLLDFDCGWDQGRLATAAQELAAEDPIRRSALIGMVQIDLEKQWKRKRQPIVEEYLTRYPELRAGGMVPVDLLRAEFEVRLQFHDAPRLEDYRRRFPAEADTLQRCMAQLAADGSRDSAVATLPLTDRASTNPGTPVAMPPPARQTQRGASDPPATGLQEARFSRADAPVPHAPRSLPAQFGRYRIIRPLGKGGMGAVYLAHDSALDREVALKVPHFDPDDGPMVLERFQREARAAAALQHPNICPVFDVGIIDGVHYFTMGYVEGKTLSEVLSLEGPLTPSRIARLVHRMAVALEKAHAAGIIHRDLKPSNVLLDKAGEPILTDFGLARRVGRVDAGLSRQGMLLGTPAYMSPEQAAGDLAAVDHRSDVWALGVILYELLTGRVPFDGPAQVVLGRILYSDPAPPSGLRPGVDARLEAICLRAMARKREDRFADMHELAAALSGWLDARSSAPESAVSPAEDEEKQPTLADTPAPAGNSPRRRRGLVVGLAAAALLLGIVLYVATDNGTIRIELNDPEAKVTVKVDGGDVTVAGLGSPLKLRAGPHHLEISGANFTTESRSFVVRRGANPVLKIELVPREQPAIRDDSDKKPGDVPIDPKKVPLPQFVTNKDVKFVRALPGATGIVRCLSFARDGKSLASGGEDKWVCLWNVRPGGLPDRKVGRLTYPVLGVVFSDDGKLLVAAGALGDKREVIVWELPGGKERSVLRWSEKNERCNWFALAVAPRGTMLAVAGPYDAKTRVWDLTALDQKPAALTETSWQQSLDHPAYALLFSEDGERLVSGWCAAGKEHVEMWDLKKRHLYRKNDGGPPHAGSISGGEPEKRGFLTYLSDVGQLGIIANLQWVSTEGQVQAWAPNAGPLRPLHLPGPRGPIGLLAAYSDLVEMGKVLIATTDSLPDGRVALWWSNYPYLPIVFAAHDKRVQALAVDPEGGLLATVAAGEVKLWSVPGGRFSGGPPRQEKPLPLPPPDGAQTPARI